MPEVVIHVAVGVIVNSNNEILISKRSSDVHQANRWEFPGGKIELNEEPGHALVRELKEELGIDVRQYHFLKKIRYDYGDKLVCLHTFLVDEFSGQPAGIEGQPVQWVTKKQLNKFQFPDANFPIINALRLDDVIQITGDFNSLDELIDKTKLCIARGIKIIHFRAHDLDDDTYIRYAIDLLDICRKQGVLLILNRKISVLDHVDADGIHLSRHLMQSYIERPCAQDKLFSVSCHNQDELLQAEKLDADYCFLSPVKPALSHDAGEALGFDVLQSLLMKISVPVYALGGMSLSDLEVVKLLNARGIAVISENWV